MTAPAKGLNVVPVQGGTTTLYGNDVVYNLCWSSAHHTERMLGEEFLSRSSPLFGSVKRISAATSIDVLSLQGLMLRAVALVCQPWTSWIGTWFLRLVWHHSSNKKAQGTQRSLGL